MKAVKCILHIGMPKCGSSALQTTLSRSPHFKDGAGRQYRYAAIRKNGILLYGAKVAAYATTAGTGYVPSVNARILECFDDRKLLSVSRQIRKLAVRESIPVFSNEAWGNQSSLFEENELLSKLGLDAEVVMYVRPQVQWFNSAWWQWGAWTGQSVNSWIEQQQRKVDWFQIYNSWKAVPGVRKVTIRLLPENILADFYSLFSAEQPTEMYSNYSLPGSVLRLFQKYRDLRENAHNSEIEFILGRCLDIERGKTPWVLEEKTVTSILQNNYEDNLNLLNILDSESQRAMEKNPAWWDVGFYGRLVKEPSKGLCLKQQEIEHIAVAAIKALVDKDCELRSIKRKSIMNKSSIFGFKK